MLRPSHLLTFITTLGSSMNGSTLRVHLVKAHDFSDEGFDRVLALLQARQGPISYHAHGATLPEHLSEEQEWQDIDDMMKQDLFEPILNESYSKPMYDFPFREKSYTWDQLFRHARQHREEWSIPPGEPIILLTEAGNELNWFGAGDEGMEHFFVQTSHWSLFLDEIDARFPIAYEIQCWLLRKLMFPTFREMAAAGHMEARGCMMDFCRDKKDVVLKMRTGDLCADCLNILAEAEAARPLVQQLFEGIDAIRGHMMFRERYAFFRRPSRLQISEDAGRLYLTELGNLELPLNPKERCLMHFFLQLPEGKAVALTELCDYHHALREIYLNISPGTNLERIDGTLRRLTDPLSGDFMQNVSRMRRKLNKLVGESMAMHYIIARHGGEGYKVKLEREMLDKAF